MNCSQCGTVNPKGTLFCNICFTPLGGGTIKTGNTLSGGASQGGTGGGNMATPVQLASPGATGKGFPRFIILENAQPTGQSITLPRPPYNPNLLIGRTDLKNGTVVDIDVNNYGGYDRGVSRKHAMLLYSNSSYFIEDWESTLELL